VLYQQLPNEYVALVSDLSLARRTWQLFGVSLSELEKMDRYDVEMMKIAIGG